MRRIITRASGFWPPRAPTTTKTVIPAAHAHRITRGVRGHRSESCELLDRTRVSLASSPGEGFCKADQEGERRTP